MTLTAPNRETFREAYARLTGVQLSDNIIELFYRMTGVIRKSQIKTNNAVIRWDGANVYISSVGSMVNG